MPFVVEEICQQLWRSCGHLRYPARKWRAARRASANAAPAVLPLRRREHTGRSKRRQRQATRDHFDAVLIMSVCPDGRFAPAPARATYGELCSCMFLPHPDLLRSRAGLRVGPGSSPLQLSAPLRPLLELPPAAELGKGSEPELHELLAEARWDHA